MGYTDEIMTDYVLNKGYQQRFYIVQANIKGDITLTYSIIWLNITHWFNLLTTLAIQVIMLQLMVSGYFIPYKKECYPWFKKIWILSMHHQRIIPLLQSLSKSINQLGVSI